MMMRGAAAGKHDLAHRLPLRRAQPVGAPADVARDRADRLLGRPHDDRQHQQRQRERGREHREADTHRLDEQREAEQAHDDRRNARERVGREPDGRDDPPLVRVLGEIDGREYRDRRADEHRKPGDVERRDDRRPDAALRVHALRAT